jgi:hypothetical protein
MAKQAEAEREKRAKVLLAQGEFLAAQTLADAAQVISTEPAALQLRYLQTLTEIAVEKNSTIIFPLYAIGEVVKDAMSNIKIQAVFPGNAPSEMGDATAPTTGTPPPSASEPFGQSQPPTTPLTQANQPRPTDPNTPQ